jgi:hypothetical protein
MEAEDFRQARIETAILLPVSGVNCEAVFVEKVTKSRRYAGVDLRAEQSDAELHLEGLQDFGCVFVRGLETSEPVGYRFLGIVEITESGPNLPHNDAGKPVEWIAV